MAVFAGMNGAGFRTNDKRMMARHAYAASMQQQLQQQYMGMRQPRTPIYEITPIGGRNQDVDEEVDDDFDYMEMMEQQVCHTALRIPSLHLCAQQMWLPLQMMSYAAMTTVPFLDTRLPADAMPPPVHGAGVLQFMPPMAVPMHTPAPQPPQPPNVQPLMVVAAGRGDGCVFYYYPDMPEWDYYYRSGLFYR
jgi:hypothetical protein